MNRHWSNTLVLVLIWALIAIAGFGASIWQLWNWLMPALFGLPVIGFWQAVGLMALSWLLFGGWRGAGGIGARRQGRRHAFTDEERERIKAATARRCG